MLATLDLIGIFDFGVSGGGLMAIRRNFDVVGIAILAVVTAVGGGVLRDLVLGDRITICRSPCSSAHRS